MSNTTPQLPSVHGSLRQEQDRMKITADQCELERMVNNPNLLAKERAAIEALIRKRKQTRTETAHE